MYLFGWTMIGSLGPVFLYTLAQSEFNSSLFKRVLLIPALTMLGVGISFNCTVGIFSGFSKKSGTFERTPKYNISNGNDQWTKNQLCPIPLAGCCRRAAMGAYVLLTTLHLTIAHHYAFQYWQMVPASAYFLVAGSSITQSVQRSYARSHQTESQTTGITN